MRTARSVIFCAASLMMWLASGSSGLWSAEPTTTSEVTGVLQSLDPEHHQATIAHEAVPGYMPAMTMSFDVRNNAETAGLKPGDKLSFRLCVAGENAWIDQLHATGAAGSGLTALAAPAVSALAVGDRLPDIDFVDARGQKRRLSDFRGGALAVTFIYTRCPFPTYCPLVNRNFQSAQSLLEKMEAGPAWHFLTITLDPAHDTPDVLQAYAQQQRADPQQWIFAGATEPALRKLGDGLGLEFKMTDGVITHNLRTAVLDGEGRLRHLFRGNTWTPQELAAAIRAAMPASR